MEQEQYIQKHGSNIREIIHGGSTPSWDDPSENYLQASKLSREGLAWETPMIPVLMQSEDLQRTTMRSSRRYDSRPFEPFEATASISDQLAFALRNRRSTRAFKQQPIDIERLAAILENSYGAYRHHGGQLRRNSPSGGALYPLDIFVVSRNVEGLALGGLYYFDPIRHGLTDFQMKVDEEAFLSGLLLPEEIQEVPLFLVITASVWRCRFKYAQRAFRFCCLEAGHLAQNILTVATDMRLGTRLFGGFIDDEIVAMLPDINGIDDFPLYVIGIGEAND